MNRIKAILIGTIIGILIGLGCVALAAIGWLFLTNKLNVPGNWDGTNTMTLLSFSLVQGAMIGGLNGSLCKTLCNWEQVIVSILLSLAMGAVWVIFGGFGYQSRLPAVIYGLALSNGTFTAVITLLILHRTVRFDQHNLLIN